MSDAQAQPAAAPRPQVREMNFRDLAAALRAGWQDFTRAPGLGLFFGAVYAGGGLLLVVFLFVIERGWMALPITVGFPLLGPFTAVGLYEISRRIATGRSWTTRDILTVIWAQKDRQLAMISWVVIIYFLFWSFFAHMLFALFLGPSALLNVTSSYAYLLEPEGLRMLIVGTAFGAVFAAILFALTVVALPLLLDRELDFVTAMLTSLEVVRTNPVVMLIWGITIAGLIFAAMLPAFLGLLVAFPVLGHASWHVYRRALKPEGAE
ncbi:MAG: DUF2189 domain-containing protein [Pseudomonadota bacterium]